MKTVKIEGFLTALTPVVHGGDEKTGAESLLRRMRFYVDGEMMEIPYIEGNAIRGYLRRLIMQDFLEKVKYEVTSERLYHCLYAGGVLEEVSEETSGKLDIELRKKIRRFIPPLSLFGASISNQAFSGKLIVGKALPICRELKNYIPVPTVTDTSIYNLLTFDFATRRAERDLPASISRIEKKKKNEAKVQMLYRYECFVPGTRFYHWFTLMDTTPIEDSCFARLIELWKERPFIGGRNASGYGMIQIDYKLPIDMQTYGAAFYNKFINENQAKIREVLSYLEKL